MLKKVAASEPGLRFNIIERGGVTVEKMLSKSNPTASAGCKQQKCLGCKQEGGIRKCQKCNHLYSYTCLEPGCKFKYLGESHNNFFTRSGQHDEKYKAKKKETREGSFIYKHQVEKHGGKEPNMKMEVLKTFRDNLTRQITESVYIFRTEQQTEYQLMNSKAEWHAPSLYTVRKQISHG